MCEIYYLYRGFWVLFGLCLVCIFCFCWFDCLWFLFRRLGVILFFCLFRVERVGCGDLFFFCFCLIDFFCGGVFWVFVFCWGGILFIFVVYFCFYFWFGLELGVFCIFILGGLETLVCFVFILFLGEI